VQYLWVRVGDADDYNHFDDLAEAAEYMAQFGLVHVWRKFKYGVDAEGFTGNNYISLFYGDEEAQPTRDVSTRDIQRLNRHLKQNSPHDVE